jgi:hypothetical protein
MKRAVAESAALGFLKALGGRPKAFFLMKPDPFVSPQPPYWEVRDKFLKQAD